MGASRSKVYYLVINDKTQGGINTFKWVCKCHQITILRNEKFCFWVKIPHTHPAVWRNNIWLLKQYANNIEEEK